MPLGFNDNVRARSEASRFNESVALARITRVDAGHLVTTFLDNTTHRVEKRPRDSALVTGDWVWCNPSTGAIAAPIPRATKITRATAAGTQSLVADVDLVWLCVTGREASRNGLIERLAAIGWDSGATPLFVITKSDLLSKSELASAEMSIARLAPGIEIVSTSSSRADGAQSLLEHVPSASTSALIGHSGVGKSSLINAITHRGDLAVGSVRERDEKGRHTTTTRQIVDLGFDSVVIDTPGLRELGLAVSDDVLDSVFGEIADLARHCRFVDCSHRAEPECAVREAVASGEIEQRRVDSYQKMQRERDYHRSKALPSQREKDREYTRFAREYRRARGH